MRTEQGDTLFFEQPARATELAGKINAESPRFNIGFVERNVNVPTFALTFVDAVNRERFTFAKTGETNVKGTRVREIEFRVWQTPTGAIFPAAICSLMAKAAPSAPTPRRL